MNIKQILDNRQCFKLVCGAGNEDVEQVRRLVYVYALAGADIFDLSAKIRKNVNIFNQKEKKL